MSAALSIMYLVSDAADDATSDAGDDGLDFVRGLGVALVIVLPFWVAVIWVIFTAARSRSLA